LEKQSVPQHTKFQFGISSWAQLSAKKNNKTFLGKNVILKKKMYEKCSISFYQKVIGKKTLHNFMK
jgi:hypothetical protein